MNCKVIARGLLLLAFISLLAQNVAAEADKPMTSAEIAILVMSAVITGVMLVFFLGAIIQYSRSG